MVCRVCWDLQAIEREAEQKTSRFFSHLRIREACLYKNKSSCGDQNQQQIIPEMYNLRSNQPDTHELFFLDSETDLFSLLDSSKDFLFALKLKRSLEYKFQN